LLYPSEFITERVRSFNGTAWFAPDFPRKPQDLIPVCEVLAPRNKHFEKLRNLIDIIPDYGFPIKIEVPVFPTVSATASFLSYQEMEVDEELFAAPEGYRRVRTKPKRSVQAKRPASPKSPARKRKDSGDDSGDDSARDQSEEAKEKDNDEEQSDSDGDTKKNGLVQGMD